MDFPPEDDDRYDLSDAPDEPQVFWTQRRLLLTIVVAIIVITFLAYTLQGLFLPPPPPPTLAPGSLI